MTRQFIKLEHHEHVTVLTIDRPDRLNALDATVLGEISDAVEEVAALGTCRAMILTGAGKAFVAGADIAAMQDMTVEAARSFSRTGHGLLARLEALPFPVIAAVNGFALGGGCELALACDFIVASEKAKFGQPEVKLGVIPGFGGTQRLSRRVGVAHARELIFSGAIIDGSEAARIGLANRVVGADALLDTARQIAQTIATMGPIAVAKAKAVICRGEGLPLDEANALETEAFAACFATADQKAGMAAFLAKGTADFKGA